ncbi:MAG: alpha/beta hydrolase [bacterium]
MKKYFLLINSILFINVITSAQSFVLPLWESDIPNRRQTNEVEVRDTSDVIRISNVQVPSITVYLPSKKNANGKAVVICPGGGYMRLAFDYEGDDVAKFFNSHGYAAVILKYRLPISSNNIVGHESPLLDVKRAMRLTRYHSHEWNFKEDQIGIIGFSAGGHLASTLGTHFDLGLPEVVDPIDKFSSRPDFMILMYPVITFTDPFCHQGSRKALIGEPADTALINYYSNELQIRTDTPPTFIVHSCDDKSVPVENSLMFYKALKEKNIPVEMHLYPEGGHGYSLAVNKGHTAKWTEDCIAWLKWIDERNKLPGLMK